MIKSNSNLKINTILLAAGKPEKGESHPLLRKAFSGTRVLDWLLQALPSDRSTIQFVGGYRLEEIANKYPDFQYVENSEWLSTGATGSLFKAVFPDDGSLIVSYSDILYRSETVDSLIDHDGKVSVAVDTNWKDRYQGRSNEDLARCEKVHLAGGLVTRLGPDLNPDLADAEFIGLVYFDQAVMPMLNKALKERADYLKQHNLSALIEWLRINGVEVRAVDVAGDWAELNDYRDLAKFVLGTKAQTLDRLRNLVTKSRIEEQLVFTVGDWASSSSDIIKRISSVFPGKKIAIRSSSLNEDGFVTANAGVCTSILNVPVVDQQKLMDSIADVINSYHDNAAVNQILVQPMVRGIKVSGVIFTRTLECGAPYYVINYDDSSGSTESITSGVSTEHKTIIARRSLPEIKEPFPDCLHGLLPALREIEELVGYDALDIEFAVNSDNVVHIFQVRPIATDHSSWQFSDDLHDQVINKVESQFISFKEASPFVVGKRAVFGVMPDWNPAEIIGTNPGQLATSLYRYLIMDEVWALQRAEYGYRDVRPSPLLAVFANHPYVDVRASFNSFVPASIEDGLAEKLVDFYLDWLELHPHLHDKVEFEVLPTCYTLNFKKWENRLTEVGNFTKYEVENLRKALFEITVNAVKRGKRDFETMCILESKADLTVKSEMDPLNKAYLLLEDCRSYGTLAFSHLARSAFVAVALLKSAVESAYITQVEMDDFLNTINTVSQSFNKDALAVAQGSLEWQIFVERYGHLRPGTYDITSVSYAEDPDRYLKPLISKAVEQKANKNAGLLWANARGRFSSALADTAFPADLDMVEDFIRASIEGREYAKFIFSRNLSIALDYLVKFGEAHGLSRNELAHICLEDLFTLRNGAVPLNDIDKWLRSRAEEGASWRNIARGIILPPLIFDHGDFSLFSISATMPNFIGSSVVTAECVDLSELDLEKQLDNKIVMIPQADPGYDWLFGNNIAGLITMYGGANSHMAIRAAEFGLPAAIGIGEAKYKVIARATALELNCENKWIKVI